MSTENVLWKLYFTLIAVIQPPDRSVCIMIIIIRAQAQRDDNPVVTTVCFIINI